ncbi:GT-D fold domain-containing glycosyltransferase, partial [Streptomyces scabiei]
MIVLLAIGPTATVLSYDLADNGLQVIDIVHLDV